ncbi:ABC transporter permease [Paenibacillus nasutitermitis]|uniref:Transport permease protein n=1 Tax=Paenibacillus nasutitermitis TaxID=1652958 RepID=A0A916YXU6_9BACL|nr:ABC transporter permease [Paenibacillus nasutitermitis]GGD66170.1 transport permease protein [Paenibacillus nasutitermitis]
MSAVFRLIAFDFRLYLRDWLTIFWILIYPVLMLVIFGSMFGNQPGLTEGSRYIDFYVPALCAMNVLSISVFTLNINIITQREKGILRRYRVSPIPVSAVLASHAVQGIVLVAAGAVEIIVIAKLIWGISFTLSTFLTLLGCLLFGCIGFFSLGFALSGLANTAGAASGIAMVFFFPMLFLSGIAMPLNIFPQFMQTISGWIPMTYFVELVQGVWDNQELASFGTELAVMGGFAVLMVLLAFILFRWEN